MVEFKFWGIFIFEALYMLNPQHSCSTFKVFLINRSYSLHQPRHTFFHQYPYVYRILNKFQQKHISSSTTVFSYNLRVCTGCSISKWTLFVPTVWKLQNFSVCQILRQIKVYETRNSNFAILPHFLALNLIL